MSAASEVSAVIRERLEPTRQDTPLKYMNLPYGFHLGTNGPDDTLLLSNDQEPDRLIPVGVVFQRRWVLGPNWRDEVKDMAVRLGLEVSVYTDEVPF